MSHSILPRSRLIWMLFALVLTLASSATQARGDERRLQVTLYDYASAFRWGEMNQILSFFDQGEESAPAPTSFDLERWKQWRVVGYRAQPYSFSKDGRAEQLVEIEITNVNTQATRKVMDKQRWHYAKKRKVWLLRSGLPALSQ